MIEHEPARVRVWGWFLGWMAIGVGFACSLLGAMTIGIFILPVVVAVTVLLATRRRSLVGLPGLVSGASLPLFYVAYLNRDGPGNICRSLGAGGRECTEEWSPMPWLVLGLLMLAAGVAVFVVTIHTRRHAPTVVRRSG